MTTPAHLVELGRTDYTAVFEDMRSFSARRGDATLDQIWITEHNPVFTQGQAGKAEHLLVPGEIPVVQSDRGGQVTYHGPGQIVAYLMFDIRRMGISVRDLVSGIEASMIRVLASYGVEAAARPDAPGVYVDGAKIGSLGLRVRRGCSYHGLALNVDMDLDPFGRINPCGLTDISVTQVRDLCPSVQPDTVRIDLIEALATVFDLTPSRLDSPALSVV